MIVCQKGTCVRSGHTSIFLANRGAIPTEFCMIVCQKGTCVRSGHTSVFLDYRSAISTYICRIVCQNGTCVPVRRFGAIEYPIGVCFRSKRLGPREKGWGEDLSTFILISLQIFLNHDTYGGIDMVELVFRRSAAARREIYRQFGLLDSSNHSHFAPVSPVLPPFEKYQRASDHSRASAAVPEDELTRGLVQSPRTTALPSAKFRYFYTDPAAGVAALLHRSGNGRCARRNGKKFCECFPPWRGAMCAEVDEPNTSRGGQTEERAAERPHAVHYIVNGQHLDELLFALNNLWEMYNSKFDYPVLLFHDDTFVDEEQVFALLRKQKNRCWLFVLEDSDGGGGGSGFGGGSGGQRQPTAEEKFAKTKDHQFGQGYAEQARFRAGPLFEHPAVVGRFEYLWGLDTDSYFPREVEADVFPSPSTTSEGEGKPRPFDNKLALGYKYITLAAPANSQNLYQSVQTWALSHSILMGSKAALFPFRISGFEIDSRLLVPGEDPSVRGAAAVSPREGAATTADKSDEENVHGADKENESTSDTSIRVFLDLDSSIGKESAEQLEEILAVERREKNITYAVTK